MTLAENITKIIFKNTVEKSKLQGNTRWCHGRGSLQTTAAPSSLMASSSTQPGACNAQRQHTHTHNAKTEKHTEALAEALGLKTFSTTLSMALNPNTVGSYRALNVPRCVEH